MSYKKFLAGVLSCSLIGGCMPAGNYNVPLSASAIELEAPAVLSDEGTTGAYGELSYIISNGEITISDCSTSATSIEIPSEIDGMPVTAIGENAFSNLSSLTDITIPDSVTTIGEGAFKACFSLNTITVSEGNMNYSSSDGVLFNKDKTLIIKFPEGKTYTSYTIPDSVTSIDHEAFYDCYTLIAVSIPDGVTSIGDRAFHFCSNLTDVNIPDSVASIGSGAFIYCFSLTDITIPDSVTTIGERAFEECKSLTSIIIPDSVTSIGESAFYRCENLTDITISDNLTTISDSAFSECTSLTSIIIPDSVTFIGSKAFYDSTVLTSITIPDSVTSIGGNAFIGTLWLEEQRAIDPLVTVNDILIDGRTCKGTVTIPNSVTSIGVEAFFQCSDLISITIPDSVTSIDYCAFYGCTGLTSVTIPDSVEYIGMGAFYSCTNLSSIKFLNPECQIPCLNTTISNGYSDSPYYYYGSIYGYPNSTAQTYAEEFGYNFVALDEATRPSKTVSGDADLDGVLSVNDVVAVMCYSVNSTEYPLSDEALLAADVYQTGDGVNSSDAFSIQKKLVNLIESLPES